MQMFCCRFLELGDVLEWPAASGQHDAAVRQVLLPQVAANASHVVEPQPRLQPGDGMVPGMEADDVGGPFEPAYN